MFLEHLCISVIDKQGYLYLYDKILKILMPMVRVFANGLGDLRSIPGRVILKTQKTVLHASLLNTQHYKVRLKDKEAIQERCSALPYILYSSYRKGSLWITLYYGRQNLLLLNGMFLGLKSVQMLEDMVVGE